MSRVATVLLALSLIAPTSGAAQTSFWLGGGATAPRGELADLAGPGYHAQVGISFDIPSLPIALRADGRAHRMGAPSSATFDGANSLEGSISLMYELPGIGVGPYLMGGIGTYKTSAGPDDLDRERTEPGAHVGFGMRLGAGPIASFVEIRVIRSRGESQRTDWMIPLTVGLRL